MRKCDRLSSILDTQIAAVVDRLEASPRSVQVRDLGYRWGSCGRKGDLYFHWRVAMLPRVMIDIMSGSITIIKPQLGATNGSLSNLELSLAVGVIVGSD